MLSLVLLAIYLLGGVLADCVVNGDQSVIADLPETPDGFTVLLQQVIKQTHNNTVTLIVYGENNSTATSAITIDGEHQMTERVCGTNDVECGRSYFAAEDHCNLLIGDIYDSDITLPKSPRSICRADRCGVCCISWANPVVDAVRNELVDAAEKVFESCVSKRHNHYVSGLTRNTLIGRTCTTQCLSNRPNGCS